MAETKTAQLIQKLAMKTTAGAVNWETTAKPDAFQVSFPSYSLLLFSEGADYVVQIYDGNGRLVEETRDTELSKQFPTITFFTIMRNMYDAARRKALKADEIIDQLLSDLD